MLVYQRVQRITFSRPLLDRLLQVIFFANTHGPLGQCALPVPSMHHRLFMGGDRRSQPGVPLDFPNFLW